MKVKVMRDLVAQKFKLGTRLAEWLNDTGLRYLEETNSWGDTFWGVYRGKGDNTLGCILMDVRHENRQRR